MVTENVDKDPFKATLHTHSDLPEGDFMVSLDLLEMCACLNGSDLSATG